MNTLFTGYDTYKGDISAIPHGSIVATQAGVSNNYGIDHGARQGKALHLGRRGGL